MKITMSARIRFNTPAIRRAVGEGTARALKKVGMRLQEKTQREMSNRTPLSKPKYWKLAEKDGRDFVAAVYQVPREDKVTSWKTRRHPKGFLRSDIQYEYDTRTKSVVVGPSKIPKLNKLQEFGGSQTYYFVPAAPPKTRSRKFRGAVYGYVTNRPSPQSIYTFRRGLKGRRYMEQGLEKSMAMIPEQFKDTVRGP